MQTRCLALMILILAATTLIYFPIRTVKASILVTEILTVDSFINEISQWTETGSNPWLNTYDADTSKIVSPFGSAGNWAHKYFTFENSSYTWINATDIRFIITTKLSAASPLDRSNMYYWNHTTSAWIYENSLYPNTDVWTNFTHIFGLGAWKPDGLENDALTDAINDFRYYIARGGDCYTAYHVTYVEFEITGYANPILVTCSISNLEGCGNWVFAEEKFYNFTATFFGAEEWANVSFGEIAFQTNTKEGLIWNNATYNATSAEWRISHNPSLETFEDPTRIKAGSSRNTSLKHLEVIYPIWFTHTCLDHYASAIDIYGKVTYANSSTSGWLIANSSCFFLYSHGGFSKNFTTWGNEDSGKIDPGGVFELWARNGSGVEIDYWFNNLQHIKMRPEIYCIVGYPSFYIRYELDYCTQNDDWIRGLYVQLQAESVVYGTERYFNWSIYWYSGGDHVEDDHYIYMFHGGDAAAQGAGTVTWFWLDFWFDKQNASSSLGGRLNAYQWPMKDNANAWLKWLSTNWGPYDALTKESTVSIPLVDGDGAQLFAESIKMVRVKARIWVQQDASYQQYVEIRNYQVFHLTQCDRPIKGLQTPTFEETVTPVMPMGGWAGSIWTGLNWLGAYLSENILYGGLNAWGIFVSFMDTIAAWLGFPNAFTNLMTYLNNGWIWLVDGFSYTISFITPFFVLIGSFLGQLITVTSEMATQWAAIFAGIWAFLDGTYTAGINVYNDLGIWQWVQLGIILYPLHLVFLWDRFGFDAVEKEIRMIMDGFGFLVNMFIRLIQLILNVIGLIIESIPVVE